MTRGVRLLAAILTTAVCARAAAFDLQYSIARPQDFTAPQLAILQQAITRVERLWETRITGYKPGVSISQIPIAIQATNAGLASAAQTATSTQQGVIYATQGVINFNVNEIVSFANWQGVAGPPTTVPGNGLNFIDEVLAHETGHVLGIGTLWIANGLYQFDTFQYTGAYGVAAYRAEFDATAPGVPVENAGSFGTSNSHWDQRMRSSVQEGNPLDPWSLDPRVGVTDRYGRDRGLEFMTGGVDPDYREPFVSRTTVQSMRDLGYTVTEFEDFNGDGLVNNADLQILRTNFASVGLQIDSMTYGDADRDRDVDGDDFLLWQRAVHAGGNSIAVPEPAGLLAMLSLVASMRFTASRRRQRG